MFRIEVDLKKMLELNKTEIQEDELKQCQIQKQKRKPRKVNAQMAIQNEEEKKQIEENIVLNTMKKLEECLYSFDLDKFKQIKQTYQDNEAQFKNKKDVCDELINYINFVNKSKIENIVE